MMTMEPYHIEHLFDTIDEHEKVTQTYNNWIYRFEGPGAYVWARAYSDDVKVVSVFGPFKSSAELTPVQNRPLFREVVSYLRVRFVDVQMLGTDGYVKVP